MPDAIDLAMIRMNGYDANAVQEHDDLRRIRAAANPQQAELVEGKLDPWRNYSGRMQAPDPDPQSAAPESGLVMPNGQPASTGNTAIGDKRLCVGFGPQAGQVMLTLERGPDWDVNEGDAWLIPMGTLRTMMPILKQIVRVKDQTGGLWQGLQLVGQEEGESSA